MPPDQQLVTQLLQQWGSGNKAALDELMPVVYGQLRKLASRCLRAERPDHTLRATALVNEAYMRLVDADVAWQDRVHFFAVSARLLRRILVDHALQRLAVHDQRKSELIELLFFGGLTYDETAAALKISPATVHRELKMAKAWLHRELTQGNS